MFWSLLLGSGFLGVTLRARMAEARRGEVSWVHDVCPIQAD